MQRKSAYGGRIGEWRIPVCPIHGACYIRIDHNLGAGHCNAPRCGRSPVYAIIEKPMPDSSQVKRWG